ncbi:MAG: hypothetical protein OXG24_13125 [Gammaproteobacteria bacterium]|nr:hypothetical protein [Gammaproteobacteria bacterium]
MDVFQVLTLCSLLGVMFVGVLAYGIYRNWQRDQLELIRAPSVDPDVSNSSDTTGRIYPNIHVSSKPKTKKPQLQPGIFADTRSEPRVADKTSEDAKQASRIDSASNAARVESPSSSMLGDADLFSATDPTGEPSNCNDVLIQPKAASSDTRETENSIECSSSKHEEEVGLSLFEKSTTLAEDNEDRQSSKPKFLRVKNNSRLERKPPQPSKRRKSKSVESLKGETRSSTRNGDSRSQRNSEDFVMFFVMGEHDGSFRMNDVGHFLQARDLVLDEMGLFCRRDQESGEVLFKVGDVFYPGSFQVEELEHYRTTGISLAMKIPNVNNAQVVFEQMLSLANECAERFMGTVKDENFNSMSNQTLAHYRSRVSDFRRKQLTMFA